MLKIADIRGWIASLGIAADNRVYIGKLDNKQQKSIGVYGRGGSGPPYIALGGLEYTTYDTKPVSLLVHDLFEKIRNLSSLDIGDTHIHYIRLMVPEPQDVGTDDGGVFEYVIWLDFIYRRK